jgi:hypothetical protein
VCWRERDSDLYQVSTIRVLGRQTQPSCFHPQFAWLVALGSRPRLGTTVPLRGTAGALPFTAASRSAALHRHAATPDDFLPAAPAGPRPLTRPTIITNRCPPPSIASINSPHTPPYSTHPTNMADVDMADAPPAKTKVAKAGASADSDKKRFEVKKVGADTAGEMTRQC